MSEKSQRDLLIGVLVFVLLGSYYLLRDEHASGKANATLLNLFYELAQKHPGTAELRSSLGEKRDSQLHLDDRLPANWIIENSTRFGSGKWVLYLDVNGTKIRGLRIRTLDSDKVHPDEAPADVALVAQ